MHFKDVSLLITHYNRSHSLARLLESFENLKISFAETVVSDDCSKAEHLAAIEELAKRFELKLVTAPVNEGLGHNINKGQAVISTPYTLYVQEDFIPNRSFPEGLTHATRMMDDDSTIDYIRFYFGSRYPYLKPPNNYGFSEMYLPFLGYRYKKVFQYGDPPHIRRQSFVSKFGKYNEELSGDQTEYQMSLSFLRNQGKGYVYSGLEPLFTHQNSTDEPSTMKRVNWRNHSNFIIKTIRDVYRQIKYNWDIYSR